MSRLIYTLSSLLTASALSGCFLSFQPQSHAGSTESVWKRAAGVSDPVSEVSLDRCERIVEVAKAQLGTPYRYGGMDSAGFDCSGFVCYVYREATGKKLPHSARMQSEYVRLYDLSMLEKGDLLFFDTSGHGVINHCGIYLGGGRFIHASSGKAHSVTISDMTRGFYKRAFRWGGKVPSWDRK